MKSPYSPSSLPPPLPTGLIYPHPVPRQKRKLVLSEARGLPFRKATGVITLFSLLASLLTFQVGWGLNLPLLAATAIGVAFWRKPHMIHHNPVRMQLGIWLALAIAVVVHFDPWTIIPFLLVTLVFIGGLLFGRSVDPMRGLARATVQSVAIPWSYLQAWRYSLASFGQRKGMVNSAFRLAAFPIFIAIGFGTLYVWSNQRLSQWTFNFFDQLLTGDWFLNSLQFGWSLFISSAIGTTLVYGMKKQDGRLLKSIGPNPAKLAESASTWSSVSVALVLVNVLAFVLNLIDGSTTWMGEISTSGAELKRGVHAGTYTLISAVVLAASYLLYNFRTAPKDYERARVLAMAWLGQNLMMCFTVALRNYHYTDAYGLTIKRIGVWLFLCCAATGLYFLGRQVRENGSIERLVRRQAWAVYLILAVAALPDWPGLITRYNHLEARLVLDKDYLNTLRPYNLEVWAQYDPDVIRRNTNSYPAMLGDWFRKPADFRAWDLKQARRAALASIASESLSPANEIGEVLSVPPSGEVEEIDDDVTTTSDVEVPNPRNN